MFKGTKQDYYDLLYRWTKLNNTEMCDIKFDQGTVILIFPRKTSALLLDKAMAEIKPLIPICFNLCITHEPYKPVQIEKPCPQCGKINDVGLECYWCGTVVK